MNILTSFDPRVLALLSAVFAAFANIMARTLLKDLKSKDILGINFLIMAATMTLVSPYFYTFQPNALSTNAASFVKPHFFVILIAAIDTAANYFYFKTFEKTESSVATPILSLAPVFTFFFGWLFINDTVSLQSLLAAIAMLITIIYFSLDKNVSFKDLKSQTLTPALISCVLFGLSAIPAKYLLDDLGTVNAPTLYFLRAALIGCFSILFFKSSLKNITKYHYKVIFLRGLLVITQWVFLYQAIKSTSAGVAVTLGNVTPIFVFIFSIFLLKEKPTPKKACAAILVVLLSFYI